MDRNKNSEEVPEYNNTRKFSTPKSEEARENQLAELAYDLVEFRLRHNLATSQEITHFLKIASSKGRQDYEIGETQKELIKTKTTAIKENKSMAELYAKAMESMQIYRGDADDSYYDIE